MAENILGRDIVEPVNNPPNDGVCINCNNPLVRRVTGWRCEACGSGFQGNQSQKV